MSSDRAQLCTERTVTVPTRNLVERRTVYWLCCRKLAVVRYLLRAIGQERENTQ